LSTTSSAQLDITHELGHQDLPGNVITLPAEPVDATFALQELPGLKQEVASRLAAHRARRQRAAPPTPNPIAINTSPARARAAKIAATVAERYARSESYREFLAAEAEKAIRQAEAAAEVAAVTARAVTKAQLNLLEELDHYKKETEDFALTSTGAPSPSAARHIPAPTPEFILTSSSPAPVTQQPIPSNQIIVRLYEAPAATPAQSFTTSHLYPTPDPLGDEGLALDDEIAFRQAPTFLEVTPPVEIPANLLEFPRQLVAARRARPRLAEGPLRDDAYLQPHSSHSQPSQLRIFEVEPAQLSSAPAAASAAPGWSSILLDAQPIMATLVEPEEPATLRTPLAQLLFTAPLELRIMAAAVDSSIILASVLAFTTAAVLTIGTLPALKVSANLNGLAALKIMLSQLLPVAGLALLTFLLFTALYQFLFFSFSEATPGMRYARIGLCTFTDENPTRRQMRRRILHTLLAACPLGLGILWSWVDTDRLGWHDRLSRMYQRSY
jgi:uncharacterized RDD family membrane protein YckC